MIRTMKYFIRKFKKGNVCVCGLRGRGKDLLTGNVIARRKLPYISNLDYTNRKNYIPLKFEMLDVGEATWKDFIKGDVNYYEFPYPFGSDIYLSDAGIYLPSQYCNEINKAYPHIATYQAISRQLSRNNFHINVQSLNRLYDKIREQSDCYLWCEKCIYIPKVNIVIQKIIEYDKYQSCVDRVKKARIRVPLLNPQARTQAKIYLDNYHNTHGDIKYHWVIYHNKSKHNTYYFEDMFKKGKKKNENNK